MALKKEDQWIAVAGLGALGFGYWYYKSHQTAVASDSSTDNTSDTSSTPDIYIPSYDLAGNNVVGPSQIYSGGGVKTGAPGVGSYSTPTAPAVSTTSPQAATSNSTMRTSTVATSGQAMTMPVNM